MSNGVVVDRGSYYRLEQRYKEVDPREVELGHVYCAMGLTEPSRSGPCWCNGPWGKEEEHHEHCRAKRRTWKDGLRLLKRWATEGRK